MLQNIRQSGQKKEKVFTDDHSEAIQPTAPVNIWLRDYDDSPMTFHSVHPKVALK